jgi:hypothetical protein
MSSEVAGLSDSGDTVSKSDSAPAGPFCPDCGRSTLDCAGCGRPLDPPRFCPQCGRRMTVRVIPTGWVARCRDHGELRSA